MRMWSHSLRVKLNPRHESYAIAEDDLILEGFEHGTPWSKNKCLPRSQSVDYLTLMSDIGYTVRSYALCRYAFECRIGHFIAFYRFVFFFSLQYSDHLGQDAMFQLVIYNIYRNFFPSELR